MTHQHIGDMISIMHENNIRYNKQFDIILEYGFPDKAAESFASEIIAKLDSILKTGEQAGFNGSMKKAILDLTNLAVKCGEEDISSAEFTKLKAKYKNCVSMLKLPVNKAAGAKPKRGASLLDTSMLEKETVTEHNCRRCGGALVKKPGESQLKCKYCGSTYDNIAAMENTNQLKDMFNAEKRKMINNLIKNLYDTVNAEYVSSEDVKNACLEVKKYLPDDFRANFYLTVVGGNAKEINAAIRNINAARYYDDVETMIKLLIKSLETEFLPELNHLVERAYKNTDMQMYARYAKQVADEAEKVDEGVFVTTLPREVFVAYSSKDMQYVLELVNELESQGLQCFVAERNLRHGAGSVQNYDKAIKEAIDSCKTFVFVSTTNSRSLGCDALKIELPYVRKQDIENSPPEYRNNYEAIPFKYKKPRVEYRIENSSRPNAADKITGEFFSGYEWALSAEEVAERVARQLVELPV